MASNIKSIIKKILFWFPAENIHVYVVKGSLWYQTDLNSRDDDRTNDIYLSLIDIFGRIDSIQTSLILDEIKKDDKIKRLLAVVMKPYNPTPLHKLWNWRMMKKVNKSAIWESMSYYEMTPMVIDFFLFKARWLQLLLNMPQVSTLIDQKKAIPVKN